MRARQPAPYQGGRVTRGITRGHRPLVWECMLGTVYARSPEGKTEYFDYDYAAARGWAQVDEHTDLRTCKSPRDHARGGDGPTGPRQGRFALWGVPPKQEGAA